MGPQGRDDLGVAGQAEHNALAGEELLLQGLDFGGQALGAGLGVLGQVLEVPNLGQAAPLLRTPALVAKGRAGQTLAVGVAAAGDGAGGARRRLEEQVLEALQIAGVGLEQQVPGDVEEMSGVARQDAAAQGHALDAVVAGVKGRAGALAKTDAAGVEADARRHLVVGQAGGAHAAGRAAHERQGQGLGLVQVSDVEGEPDIADAVGEDGVLEQRGRAVAAGAGLDNVQLAGDVLHAQLRQQRNGGGVLRGVLGGLEGDGLVAQALDLGLRELGFGRGHFGGEALVGLFGERRRGLEDEGQPVWIVEQPVLQSFFEESWVGLEAGPQVGDLGAEAQAVLGVAAEIPKGVGAHEQRDGEGRGDLFAGELDLVERRLDELRVEPVLHGFGEGLEDEGLDGVGGLWVRAPQTKGDPRLPTEGAVRARRENRLAQARVDQRLAHGRPGRAGERGDGDVERQAGLGVGSLVRQPVDGDEGLVLGGLVAADGVGDTLAAGLAPARLQRDVGLDLDRFHVADDALDKLQIVRQLEVAIEEEVGVGGGVEPLMKGLEGLERQVRNLFRIPARVMPIRRLARQRLEGLAEGDALGRGVGALHLVVDHAGDG